MTQTTIEPNKVQLAERDIEDWLYANPGALRVGSGYPIEKWIGRQVELPSGIADLIGMFRNVIVVVEVKNVNLTADAMTQVCRYAADIEALKYIWNMENLDENIGEDEYEFLHVWKVVVFKGGIETKQQFEADALGVELHSFDVKLDLDISGHWRWNRDKSDAISEQREQLARSSMFDEVKARAVEVHANQIRMCEEARARREAEEAETDEDSEPSSEN